MQLAGSVILSHAATEDIREPRAETSLSLVLLYYLLVSMVAVPSVSDVFVASCIGQS